MQYLIDNGFKESVDLVYINPHSQQEAISPLQTVVRQLLAILKKEKKHILILYRESHLWNSLNKELMSEKGSIYLHIDYKIGHYVKVMMEEVFGIENFRNDIARIKCNPKNFPRLGYGNIKDIILFYTKTDKAIWNEPKVKYSKKDIETLFPKIDLKAAQKLGRNWIGIDQSRLAITAIKDKMNLNEIDMFTEENSCQIVELERVPVV